MAVSFVTLSSCLMVAKYVSMASISRCEYVTLTLRSRCLAVVLCAQMYGLASACCTPEKYVGNVIMVLG